MIHILQSIGWAITAYLVSCVCFAFVAVYAQGKADPEDWEANERKIYKSLASIAFLISLAVFLLSL